MVSAILAVFLAVGTHHSYGSAASASELDHPEIDDIQLLWVCVSVGLIYVVVTMPTIVLNLVEYFLPGWPALRVLEQW